MANNLLSGAVNWGGLFGAPSASDIGGLFSNKPQPNYPPVSLMSQIPGGAPPPVAQPVYRQAPPRTAYESMERYIPPHLRGMVPTWEGLGKGLARFGTEWVGPQAGVHGAHMVAKEGVRGLLDPDLTAEQRAYALANFGMLPLAVLTTLPFVPGKVPVLRAPVKPKPTSIVQTADLRTLSIGDALKAARSEPHLIQSKGGQYVGAPRGMTSTDDILKMRANFDERVAAGAHGADWYTRGRRFNVASQPSRARQSEAAREQAIWSSQADPDPNLNWAVHAATAREAGPGVIPRILRTGAQVRKYLENKALGLKTGPYAQHLDPTQQHGTTGTNDIWHGRAFGYKGEGDKLFARQFSAQEHRFLDYETILAVDRANAKNLGGRSNWTPEELQASAWVATKGREIAARRNLTVPEGMAIARKSYPEYAPKYTVSATSEQIPGQSTGLGLLAADDAAQFTRESIWGVGPHGQDTLLGEVTGGYTMPSQKAVGAYRNQAGQWEYNPVEVHRQLVPFEAKGSARFIPAYMREGLSSTQAVRGLLDMQEGSAWSKVITHGKGPFNAFNLNTAKAPTKSQMRRTVEVAEKYNIDVVANKDGGLAFTKFGADETQGAQKAVARELNKLLKGDLGNDLRKVYKDADFVRGKWDGDYIDLSKELAIGQAGKGLATTKVLGRLNELKKVAPGFYDNLINSTGVQIKSQKNLARYNKWLAKLGGTQRADYVKLLDIVGKDKLKGLIEYVKKYGAVGLPAIAGVALSSSLRDVHPRKNSQSTEGRT